MAPPFPSCTPTDKPSLNSLLSAGLCNTSFPGVASAPRPAQMDRRSLSELLHEAILIADEALEEDLLFPEPAQATQAAKQ